MINIFELSEECSGGAEDCKLLLHPASFFMFVFHVKNVSLLQGGAGRGGAGRGERWSEQLSPSPGPSITGAAAARTTAGD